MWHFSELQQGEPERDPHEAEFFRLSEPTEAIVREFIQNSLDAKLDAGVEVRVRFYIGSISGGRLDAFLGPEFHAHLEASGISVAVPSGIKLASFLTVEDFNTSGLDGETGERTRPEGRNNFYNFWLCEGKSKKSGRDAGRWGVGKTTFHYASLVRSFWGVTVRHDDKRKLMLGKALFKSHRLNNRMYRYYGYYAGNSSEPIGDQSVINKFENLFSLQRGEKTGLSLVIPMPDGDITTGSITRAVIYHYFYAILSGNLAVEICDENDSLILDSKNLVDEATCTDWSRTTWKGTNSGVTLNFIKRSMGGAPTIGLPKACGIRLEITADSFGDELDRIRNEYADLTPVSVRVPVLVQEIGGSQEETYVDVYLQKDPTLRESQEYYIRSGITIVGTKLMGPRSVRALFLATHRPVTEFLGDAETPAHTEWNERTEGFKQKYVNAVNVLRYIRGAMRNIVAILDQPPSDQQTDFLKDIFSVPFAESDNSGIPLTDRSKVDVPPSPQRFQISDLADGLRVSLLDKNISLPTRITMRVAYDIRRGNPFRKYDKNDFDFAAGELKLSANGIRITRLGENVIEGTINTHDFFMELTGFDRRRDVIAEIKEILHETAN